MIASTEDLKLNEIIKCGADEKSESVRFLICFGGSGDEEAEELLSESEAPAENGAEMDLSGGDRVHCVAVSVVSNNPNFIGRHAALAAVPVLRLRLRRLHFYRIEAPAYPRFRAAAAAAHCVPHLRLLRRRENAPADAPRRCTIPTTSNVVHLDAESSPQERLDLRKLLAGAPTFARFNNVRMISKANLVTYRGPTMVANTLHAAAILLKEGGNWDWFQRAKPIIIDPGLYMSKKADVFWITQRRSVPTAFKLFTGSAWMVLSRPFIDFCIWGWDNLPRTVLMYYANFVSSPEGYFHTVICNAQEFKNTTVNSDLHFISWDNPPKQHPHYLTLDDMKRMVDSNAPFARKFHHDDPVLDKIDSDLLFRGQDMLVPGGWCVGSQENGTDPCSAVGDVTLLKPSAGAKRLESLISSLLSGEKFRPRQCK
nr:beta-glucuronosyltransferase GlcAT14B-like [Ipomoea batatas]